MFFVHLKVRIELCSKQSRVSLCVCQNISQLVSLCPCVGPWFMSIQADVLPAGPNRCPGRCSCVTQGSCICPSAVLVSPRRTTIVNCPASGTKPLPWPGDCGTRPLAPSMTRPSCHSLPPEKDWGIWQGRQKATKIPNGQRTAFHRVHTTQVTDRLQVHFLKTHWHVLCTSQGPR